MPPQRITLLGAGEADRPVVQLVRCGACGSSGWDVAGVPATRVEALAALSAAHAPEQPAAAPRRTAAARRPTADPRREELTALLAGWQVLPSTGS